MGTVALLSLTSALNPTLIAATTVMLLLPHPERLMLGYLGGALTTSITLGLVILFALPESSTSKTTQHTLSPIADLALGALMFLFAFVLATDRDRRLRQRRQAHHPPKEKETPRWQRALSKGSPRVTFLIGAALTLPGASYLAGLDTLHRLNYSTPVDVLVVIGFNIVMLALIEVPLVCFTIAPEWTPGAIQRAKAGVGRHWRSTVVKGLIVIGALLIIKGVIGLIVH